ncbi:MAG: M15 family metallopeptidase [Bacteroidota bacterium]
MITGLDLYEKYGDPNTVWDEGKYMTIWEAPQYIWENIPAIPRRIYCHYQMIVPLEIALLNVIDRGLTEQIKTWDGCFQVRAIRGFEQRVKDLIAKGDVRGAMIYMSIHSWGIAIDINAAWNGLGKQPQMSNELVMCFKDAGFDWGGDWKRKDGMHYQLEYLTTEKK